MSPTSPTSNQSWARFLRPGYDDNIRVSDAERAAVAERLGAHYSDGRLDKEEFDERVARAMSAKTRADLNGLFDDLPDDHPAGGTGPAAGRGAAGGVSGPAGHRQVGCWHRGGLRPVAGIVLAILAASILWHAAWNFFFVPWFLVMVVIAAVLFANRGPRRSRYNR